MITVNIHEAKTNLSKLLAMVEHGETITIAKAGRPIATIQPIVATKKPKRTFGSMKGQILVADNFDAPLPDDLLAEFYPTYDNWYQFFEPEEDKNADNKKKKIKPRKKHK